MCYNTISRHCYEVLNPKFAKQMDTIGYITNTLNVPIVNATMILGLMGYF